MTVRELIFIWYAGMIRGAIAFGLVLRIDKGYLNREVIVTTSLSLVIFTTVVFGSTVGVVQKCLFDKKSNDFKSTGAGVTVLQISENEKPEDEGFESVDLSESDSEYERILHPNEEKNDAADI